MTFNHCCAEGPSVGAMPCLQVHSTLNLSPQPIRYPGGATSGEGISARVKQPTELGMFPRKQCDTLLAPATVWNCSDVQPPTEQKEGSARPRVLGKRKGFGPSQGIEGMSDFHGAEHRGTARPQHLTHSGVSPWIKAAKHGGSCWERGDHACLESGHTRGE